MDTNNQVIPDPTTQITKSEVKKCNHMPAIVTLAILAVCGFAFGGFELYNNMQNKNQPGDSEIECPNSEESINEEDDDNGVGTVISGDASFDVPNPPIDNDGTVKFEYGIYDDILFTYSIYYYGHPYGHIVSEVISNNVDINTGEKLDNTKVLARANITIEDVYRKILANLADTVSIDSFLLNTHGDISGDTISVDDFKNNISQYVEQLKNNQNNFYILLKNSKIEVSYLQDKILEELGMSSHMNSGLVRGYVEVEL